MTHNNKTLTSLYYYDEKMKVEIDIDFSNNKI